MSIVSFILLVGSIAALLGISAFLSGSETAFLSLNRIRLRHLAKKDSGGRAALVQRLIANIEQLISTILISNNFVNVAISSLAAAAFYYFLGPKIGIITSTVVVTILILIFSEITPKIFAAKHSEKYSFAAAPVMRFIINALSPLSKVFTMFSNFIIKKIFGAGLKKNPVFVTEEEIKTMIEVGEEEGALENEERKMLHRVFEFNDIEVSRIMIPRDEIVAADVNLGAKKLLDLLIQEGYARIPVYEDKLDNVIGIMYARDLLKIWQGNEKLVIRDLVRPAYFVPSDKNAMELLKDFQRKRIQIALVVDNDDKVVGLISLEDLLEEIVGEIRDWHD
ncbi:MAG: HlyC/CorC family transporter [Candidatus Omnitrophica bacterium]|nr:HlyC/CorC family transporter [Candidatus Omnitrophota bacterium]